MSDIRVKEERIKHLLDTADVEVATIFDKVTSVTVKLENGFCLVESSGCVDVENYNLEIGKEICLKKIEDKLWELEGYSLQKEVYEGHNTKMSFGLALEYVKQGMGMRLPHWNPDVVIRAQFPDNCSKMTAPYLYVESRFGRVPWKETMVELFSEEWEVKA